MAYLVQTHTAPSLAQRASDRFNTALQSFKNYRSFRKTVAELEGLSLRDLDDLGITRGDIRRLASEAAYGV